MFLYQTNKTEQKKDEWNVSLSMSFYPDGPTDQPLQLEIPKTPQEENKCFKVFEKQRTAKKIRIIEEGSDYESW